MKSIFEIVAEISARAALPMCPVGPLSDRMGRAADQLHGMRAAGELDALPQDTRATLIALEIAIRGWAAEAGSLEKTHA